MVPSIRRSTTASLSIPSNTEENYLGKALFVVVNIQGVLINLLDKINEKNHLIRNKHKDIRTSFDMSCVIDLETYLEDDNIHKLYALGFRTNLNENPVVYYIDKKFNQSENSKYNINPILRDDKIIKVTIKKGIYSLVIKDSYGILTSSLKKLSEDFGVKTSKSLFPYKFSTRNPLEYIGSTPAMDYYNNISIEEYRKIYTEL
ncbi:uncharacterized protein RAG0_17763 [Rhynchosporium agropyri]|uniref:Probable DNA polymerase n=1 Tax=Rhynchosporium agropyri TaxID=914238 RepID=A0A1E1LU11_9HELO|nr:uncharacterized protein RAG0_17763 [Rhynchosporium agropyri]